MEFTEAEGNMCDLMSEYQQYADAVVEEHDFISSSRDMRIKHSSSTIPKVAPSTSQRARVPAKAVQIQKKAPAAPAGPFKASPAPKSTAKRVQQGSNAKPIPVKNQLQKKQTLINQTQNSGSRIPIKKSTGNLSVASVKTSTVPATPKRSTEALSKSTDSIKIPSIPATPKAVGTSSEKAGL